MRLGWRHYPMSAEASEARGYLNMAFHLYQALKKVDGLEVVDCGDSPGHPRMVLHVCPPHFFKPHHGKTNIVFSMWEGDVLPDEFVKRLSRADVCIVPSSYCKNVWRRHDLEADVVPLGVNPAFLHTDPTRRLIREGHTLRYLYIGSRASRKGWQMLGPAWRIAFEHDIANVQLYVKTIADRGKQSVSEYFNGRVIIDSRDMEMFELIKLYESADVFVFPTYGEGFGLPALEAMASGCLVAAPETGGLTEFVSQLTALVIERSEELWIDYGAKFRSLVPTPSDVALALKLAYEDWGTPRLESRRDTGVSWARRYTWEHSAQLLVDVLASKSASQGRPSRVGPLPGEERPAGGQKTSHPSI
jgi:glycosyltransferase involved in cell wall biosynthesis